MDASVRQQPRRAARDKHGLSNLPLKSLKQEHMSGPRSPKKSPRTESRYRRKKGAISYAKARALATKALEKKVSSMDQESAWLEQSGLLGALPPKSPGIQSLPSPKLLKAKRGRGRKKKSEEDMYMDDFLLSDEETGHPGGLRRAERWIPEMEHRRRPGQKPRNIPSQLWMSYCLMDDYIYRQSLTDEEVLAHPLMDDVLEYQQGGSSAKVVPPPGFQWNEKRRLVPILEN
ncbi:hypothetical protein F5Y00DRAFT_270477 [Daldinia vernicosa]|uniref:uncharacterized protein n=1 Tax=Daldinia vernicosa TaxID=114800 RepID=UPI00200829E1|nr:uncharacterized protein F5Y00DRAFT_270477 [Daldinia vernicosa]KAI0848048.1 hypothetical protein F5Y00DRAFT_270477 [Daldinia vernicosa]